MHSIREALSQPLSQALWQPLPAASHSLLLCLVASNRQLYVMSKQYQSPIIIFLQAASLET